MKDSFGTDGNSLLVFKPSGSLYNLCELISPWLGVSPSASLGINLPHGLVVIGETFYPTGNNKKDLLAIQTYYQQFKGKKPDQF